MSDSNHEHGITKLVARFLVAVGVILVLAGLFPYLSYSQKSQEARRLYREAMAEQQSLLAKFENLNVPSEPDTTLLIAKLQDGRDTANHYATVSIRNSDKASPFAWMMGLGVVILIFSTVTLLLTSTKKRLVI